MRNLFDVVDTAVEFGHRVKQRAVINLLIGVAILEGCDMATGDGDHRRMTEVGVLHAGGEIGRPHRLRHADAGPAGDARITVGHVGDAFLGVAEHARNTEVFHFGERTTQHRVHEKYM